MSMVSPEKPAWFGEIMLPGLKIPRFEERHGLAIEHPRYPLFPKIGMSTTPFFLFAATLPLLRRQIALGKDFDAIDAHYMYP